MVTCNHIDHRGASSAMMEDDDFRYICNDCLARFYKCKYCNDVIVEVDNTIIWTGDDNQVPWHSICYNDNIVYNEVNGDRYD